MDRSKQITLVSVTYTTDSIGQRIETETEKSVFCNLQSVSLTEWTEGGKLGLHPEYRATMFSYDYSNEEIAIIDEVRYSVYRTFRGKNDMIELYLEKRVGA